MMMMAIFIAHGSIDSMLSALKEIIDKKCTGSPADMEKIKGNQKTGEFLDVCGTSQRNLLP